MDVPRRLCREEEKGRKGVVIQFLGTLVLRQLVVPCSVCAIGRVREVRDRDQHACTVGVLAATHQCAAESRVTQQSANSVRVVVLLLSSRGVNFARVVVWTRTHMCAYTQNTCSSVPKKDHKNIYIFALPSRKPLQNNDAFKYAPKTIAKLLCF